MAFVRRRSKVEVAKAWRAALAAGISACALAAIVASAPAARAESLNEALSATYTSNPKLDAERARLRATDEDVARANAGYRPVVTGQADTGRQVVKTIPNSTRAGNLNPYG